MAADGPTGSFLSQRLAQLPLQPGVYLFKDARGRLLYVGKALSLRKRIASYVQPELRLAPRIARMVTQVADLEVRITASEAEALLLEAQIIKEHRPHYNVAFRDDKSYPMLKITKEPFPRLVVTRRRLADGGLYFGPYTDAGLMHQAVRFLRRVFPLRTCKTFPKTPCLEYHLGQCLAPCADYLNAAQYQRIVNDLVAFLRGDRDQLLQDLSRRMKQAARDQRYEEAGRLRDQIQALSSIVLSKEKSLAAGPLEQLQAALKLPKLPGRIEAFDISNTFGAFAVGSMIVFTDGQPHKAHYRKFRIRTVQGIDDYRMMREIIRRRYSGSLATKPGTPPKAGSATAERHRARHSAAAPMAAASEVSMRAANRPAELPIPDLILIDGGKGQLAAAGEELAALSLTIPIMGLAKRFEHIFLPTTEPGYPRSGSARKWLKRGSAETKASDPIVLLPGSPVLHLVQRIRDEAHRFAITYHRTLRGKTVSASILREIPGIGAERARRLLAHFKSLTQLSQASPEEIVRVGGVSQAIAAELIERLSKPEVRVFRMKGNRTYEAAEDGVQPTQEETHNESSYGSGTYAHRV